MGSGEGKWGSYTFPALPNNLVLEGRREKYSFLGGTQY